MHKIIFKKQAFPCSLLQNNFPEANRLRKNKQQSNLCYRVQETRPIDRRWPDRRTDTAWTRTHETCNATETGV